MTRQSKIYAKEQQIKLIDNILCSLCSLELNSDGRKYIKKLKTKITSELERLKGLEEEKQNDEDYTSLLGFKLKLPESLKAPW